MEVRGAIDSHVPVDGANVGCEERTEDAIRVGGGVGQCCEVVVEPDDAS